MLKLFITPRIPSLAQRNGNDAHLAVTPELEMEQIYNSRRVCKLLLNELRNGNVSFILPRRNESLGS